MGLKLGARSHSHIVEMLQQHLTLHNGGPYSRAENHAFCSSIREDRAVCPDSFMLKCRSTKISACRLGGRFFSFLPSPVVHAWGGDSLP